MNGNPPIVEVYDLGNSRYRHVWDLQKHLQSALIEQKRHPDHVQYGPDDVPDMLLFVEHPHVYTLGKSGNADHLLRSDEELKEWEAEFVPVDRGGDITYHGPGQVVGYPILDLDRHFTDIHKYLRFLEEVIILTVGHFGIVAGRSEGLTGVWVEDRKIAAMGIRSSRWVTMHGFALNVEPNLSYFSNIVPCGIQDKQVTSIYQETGTKPSLEEVKSILMQSFDQVFGVKTVQKGSIKELEEKFSYFYRAE